MVHILLQSRLQLKLSSGITPRRWLSKTSELIKQGDEFGQGERCICVQQKTTEQAMASTAVQPRRRWLSRLIDHEKEFKPGEAGQRGRKVPIHVQRDGCERAFLCRYDQARGRTLSLSHDDVLFATFKVLLQDRERFTRPAFTMLPNNDS